MIAAQRDAELGPHHSRSATVLVFAADGEAEQDVAVEQVVVLVAHGEQAGLGAVAGEQQASPADREAPADDRVEVVVVERSDEAVAELVHPDTPDGVVDGEAEAEPREPAPGLVDPDHQLVAAALGALAQRELGQQDERQPVDPVHGVAQLGLAVLPALAQQRLGQDDLRRQPLGLDGDRLDEEDGRPVGGLRGAGDRRRQHQRQQPEAEPRQAAPG